MPADSRLDILPSGVRIVRLGARDDVWLREYDKILRGAAQDFLTRSHQAGTPEGVIEELAMALTHPQRAVWLVVRADYRLLGFALAEIVQEFGAPPRVFVQAAYLWPNRTPRSVLPALTQAIRTWGVACGAASLDFQTRRTTGGAWARVGARPVAILYTMALAPQGDG